MLAGLSVIFIILNTKPIQHHDLKVESYAMVLPIQNKLPGHYGYSEEMVLSTIASKQIRRYIINGDANELVKYTLLRDDYLRLHRRCDTTKVEKVHFTDDASYGDFFRLVRMLRIDSILRYALVERDLYIFGTITEECK